MFRTSRTARRGRAALTRELLRNEKRVAKLEAERNKSENPPYHPGSGAGGM